MSHILQKVAPIGESRDKEILKSASSYIYTDKDGIDLLAHVFFPELGEAKGRPVAAMFHGGFWDTAMATQFVPHCHHFAERGVVSIAFEYRTSSRHKTGPLEAIEDARIAMAWLHENADLLGIDTTNLVLFGASGGAFLALQLALNNQKENELPISPKALVLFSALVNTAPATDAGKRFPSPKTAKALSPANLLRRKLPPMIFFHGKADRTTLYEDVASFRRRMKWRRNKCEIIDFAGADHSFFNFNVSHENFEMTINAADRFLVEHDVLTER
ncbi:MAG: alpha/beta hydrolase, partial [Luteolibacter sp.]